MSSTRVEEVEELFLVPAAGKETYLYAPLRRGVASLNASALHAVDKYLRGGTSVLGPEELPIIEELSREGILGGPAPKPPLSPAGRAFRPYEATLFLTTRCNLRCVYCYAEGGSGRPKELSWEAAKAAIDLVARNAGLCGRDNFIVGFHGGGEPTLAWDLMRRCVEYARDKAAQMGLKANIHSATNGVLAEEQREYIASRFTGLNVSLDGPREIQDRNRPRAGGGGSFDAVMESLRFFTEAGFSFGVRATVTARSVSRLPEICAFLFDALPGLSQLHVEPVWYCGRCRTSGELPPEPLEFAEAYLRARREAEEAGRQVLYSGARLDMLTSKFCAAPGEGFSVMPDGLVSSCYEVCEASDPRSGIFHYGRYDEGAGEYVFDEGRLEALRGLSVDKIPFCRDCFCRWHCAGDCLAKALKTGSPEGHGGSDRCAINRRITAAGLGELVSKSRKGDTGDGR